MLIIAFRIRLIIVPVQNNFNPFLELRISVNLSVFFLAEKQDGQHNFQASDRNQRLPHIFLA